MSVVTSPSVVIVPTQVPSLSAASSEAAQAVNDRVTTAVAIAARMFIASRG
jgi:hypothetical protein